MEGMGAAAGGFVGLSQKIQKQQRNKYWEWTGTSTMKA